VRPALALVLAGALCGCTSAMPGTDGGTDGGRSAGNDAGPDAGPDAGANGGADAGRDAGPLIDGGADAGSPVDAGPDAGAPGDAGAIAIPAAAPYGQWTYFQTPGASCANGTPGGFALNPSSGSTDLMIWMRAGNMCYDYDTCITQQVAAFLNGYDDAGYQMDLHGLLRNGAFDRTQAANPFRAFNFAYIPYCTGDLHSGNQVTTYTAPDGGMGVIHHVGYANVGAVLQRLVPTFPSVRRVVVTGSSAGGFGAAFNYQRIKAAFPAATVYLVDDSGPYLAEPFDSKALQDAWKANWGFVANLPANCPQGDPDLPDGGTANLFLCAAQDPTFRGALIESLEDSTISNSFAAPPDGDPALPCVPMDAGCEFPGALLQLAQAFAAAPGELRVFYPLTSQHQQTIGPSFYTDAVDGGLLTTFLADELDGGGPGWASEIAPNPW